MANYCGDHDHRMGFWQGHPKTAQELLRQTRSISENDSQLVEGTVSQDQEDVFCSNCDYWCSCTYHMGSYCASQSNWHLFVVDGAFVVACGMSPCCGAYFGKPDLI